MVWESEFAEPVAVLATAADDVALDDFGFDRVLRGRLRNFADERRVSPLAANPVCEARSAMRSSGLTVSATTRQ